MSTSPQRVFLASNEKARNKLRQWVNSRSNLYEINSVFKMSLFHELEKYENFKSDSLTLGFNAAFINFVSRLVDEYNNDDSDTADSYKRFLNDLNTLNGKWSLPLTHINRAHDYPPNIAFVTI